MRGALERRLLPSTKTQITFGKLLVPAMGLTVAADIVGTIGHPSWEEIGKLGALIVLRTIVSYFLAKEIDHAEARVPAAREAWTTTLRERLAGARLDRGICSGGGTR